MRFLIRNRTKREDIEISEQDFGNLKKIKRNLLEALSIEEKIDILLENYAELEKELLNIAIDYSMFYDDHNYSLFANKRNLINRRILNFLASCRMYIDQTSHSFSKIYGQNSENFVILTKLKSKEYDDNLAYKVIDSLRNHVQHFNLPVDSLTIKNSAIENIYREHSIEVYLKIESLKENEKFKKSVLDKLIEKKQNINLISYIRKYLESLGHIHFKIRDIFKPDLEKWDKLFLEFINTYKTQTKTEQFTIISYENNCELEQIDLLTEIIEYRKKLETKNKYLDYFSIRYVSGKSPLIT